MSHASKIFSHDTKRSSAVLVHTSIQVHEKELTYCCIDWRLFKESLLSPLTPRNIMRARDTNVFMNLCVVEKNKFLLY